MSMHDLNTSPSRQSYVQSDQDITTSDYESFVDNRRNGYGEQVFGSDNQTGTVFIRISVPELRIQKCLQFELDETVWQAKQRVLATFAKDLKDSLNYGLYCPPMNGRAGKFLDEERLLREYPLQGPIGFLEFKYKKRVYKMMHVNPRKLKQLHVKGNLRHFLDYVKTCNVEKVTKLTNKGLDPNFHDSNSGETPLSIAVMQTKQKSKELILSLTGGGAHLDFRNRQGMTPLHKAVLIENVDAVKTLLDLGVSPNLKDARGLTPLYYCVANGGSPVLTEMLLQERATIGAQDEQGWAEIHQACRQGLVQHLEHLLYYGADLNQQNASGNTALHVCALNNKESCARVLLFRGASKDILNFSNQDAYQVAIISGNNDLAEIIQNHNPRDAVPFREPPKYSNRRQDSVATAAMFALSRSRSDPKLNLIMHERFITPSSSSHSLRSHTSHTTDSESCSPSRGGYETDSPCSMSISSTSSGPGYGFTYGYPPGYGFHSVRHRLNDRPRLPPHFYRHSTYNGINSTYNSVYSTYNGVNNMYNNVKSQNDICHRHSMYEGLNSYNDVMSQRLNIYGMKSKVQASRSLNVHDGQNVQIGFQSYRSSFECTSPRHKANQRLSLFEQVNGNPYYNECQQNNTCQYNEPCQYSALPEKLYICMKPHIPVYARDLHLKQGDIVEGGKLDHQMPVANTLNSRITVRVGRTKHELTECNPTTKVGDVSFLGLYIEFKQDETGIVVSESSAKVDAEK